MGVYAIRGLVAATLLFALSKFREVKSTPVFLELNTDPRGNTVNSSTQVNNPKPSDHHQIPFQNLQDVTQRNNDSEESVVNAVNSSYTEDDDTNNDYSGDFADYNDTYYEYNYDYDDYKNYGVNDDDDDYDYEEADDDFDYNDENYDSDDNNKENYDSDDDNDENYDSDDDNDENYDIDDANENHDSDDDNENYNSDDDNENYDSDDDNENYDSDDDNEYDDDYDDYDDNDDTENQESASNHHHHLITGQNGASIQVDDDGKVYMFLNVNETFDPSKYYLEVGNNTKLLLDLGGTLGNETADYELVKHPDLDGAREDGKGTESSITNRSYFSTNQTNDIDAKERSVVLLNVADAEEEGKGSNDKITNKDDPKNKMMTIFFGEGDNSPGNEMFTLTPGFPNDSDISVGWSSATISDDNDSTWPPEDQADESSYWFDGTLSPSRDVPSDLTTTDLYDFDGRYEDDYNLGEDEPGEDVPKSILDMSDEELQEFIETYPELIESDNEEFEGNGTEPEMTTSALMFGQHRDVIENFNGSESLSAGNHTVLEEEQMDPGAESDLTWLLIPPQSGDQTHKPTNNTDIDYSQIHQEFISSNNLTDEEQLELGGLERLRRTTEALGGLSTLRKDSANHHIVRRQLSNTEACGSFSRRRRDTGSKDVVNAEGQRYKRGVSNVGRRLEMGNPAFRQLYNQYKNMCNFIAMVAFEK